MKPKDFIAKYGLNKGWNKNHQRNFLQDFTSELIALLEYNKAAGNLKGFDNAVRSIKMKWDAVSNKIPYGLPDGMWKYFFATVIAKMREELCPQQMQKRREEQARKRERYEMWKREEQAFQDEINNMYRERYERLLFFLSLTAIPHEAFSFLNLTPEATEEEVKARYRELAVKLHPDHGGNSEAFLHLTECKNKCLKYIKTR